MITKIEDIQSIVNEIARQQIEYTESTLAEIITKYDFIVGSMECKRKLMDILPKGANIIYSPFIENPTMIYAIKKFSIMDLFENPYKAVRGWYMDELENRDAEVFDKWLDSTEESPRKFYLRGVKMSEREIERILQECDNEEEVEKAIEEYLKKL